MTEPVHRHESTAALADIRVLFAGRAALDGVSLSVSPAALSVIAGPNGAGKSTLLGVLAGTVPPTSGRREVMGSASFVPQRAVISPLVPVTVRDVVTVGVWGSLGPWRRMSAGARERVDAAMLRVDVGALADHPFASLSGGQQQRTLLAQGLARDADLLLLDEPTTGLDAASSHRIRAIMREEADHGAAVVCVTHDDDVIADADVLVPLVDGRIDDALIRSL